MSSPAVAPVSPAPGDGPVIDTGASRALEIGPLSLDLPVVLAPMAGVTNAPFRTLCRRFGAGLYVSEMISARALCEGSEKTDKLASFAADETPRSLQLAGVEPLYVGRAVERLVGEGRVDHIDLNFGCPVRKVTRHGGGGALPFKRHLYSSVVAAAVDAAGAVPVTVKLRVGIDDGHKTYLDAGRIAEDSGVAAVALHGRTVAQLYSGQADWSTIARLKEAVATIPVLGNGDIWEADDALAMMDRTGCDGVVIGRGCLGRPWLFGQLAAAFTGRPVPPPPTVRELVPIMTEHAALLVQWFGDHKGIREFRKHTAWYLKGYPVGGELRGALGRLESLDRLAELLAPVADAPLPDENRRVARGHTRGPQVVALPDGWLDDPYDDAVASADG
ncbi:MAG: tRNA dihydrouridine synthase DusB, partial [Acidimicrobiales bacterium]